MTPGWGKRKRGKVRGPALQGVLSEEVSKKRNLWGRRGEGGRKKGSEHGERRLSQSRERFAGLTARSRRPKRGLRKKKRINEPKKSVQEECEGKDG